MPDYVPILDRGRNAKEREIGSSTMCLPNYYIENIFTFFITYITIFSFKNKTSS